MHGPIQIRETVPISLFQCTENLVFGPFLHEFYEAFRGSSHNETHHSLILHRLPLHRKAILHLKFIPKVTEATVQCSNISNYVLNAYQAPPSRSNFSDEGYFCLYWWEQELNTVLWNHNYFLRFRFRLLKSFVSDSGSGSGFWQVTVPVPTFGKLRFRFRLYI